MCGIIGIISKSTNIFDQVLNGLKQLQNRGYDSAGIGSIETGKFIMHKYASTEKVTSLEKIDKILHLYSNVSMGIGHTRWATHGAKNDINSHPHISSDNKFMIVHNGIIENFSELKEMLIKNGYFFLSETDTEVIANLLAFNYKHSKNVLQSIEKTIEQLHGTWGLLIMCIDTPDELYCTRNGSPILIGENDDNVMIASEQCGFSESINNYIVLKNYDICCIKLENDNIYINTKHSYNIKKRNMDNYSYTCEPFPHWTLKEIFEQKESILRAISFGGRVMSPHNVKLGGLNDNKKILLQIDNLLLLGCGTSYNSGMIGVHYFKDLCDFNCVQLFDGAEFEESDIPRIGKSAAILLSQSGETKDLYRCIKILKNKGIFTIGVINVVDSLIAREVDCGCYLNAGREVAVASTKSFTSQCIILSMIAIWFSQNKNINETKRIRYINDLIKLTDDVKELLNNIEEKITEIIPVFDSQNNCFILGKGKSHAIACEGSLKIKEISYIHSESYSTSSLKHGPFALLCEKFPVILIAPRDEHFSKNENAYNEIKSRHASIIVITNNYNNSFDKKNIIYTPTNNTYQDILSIIPLQMLSYKLSVSKGINPDMPKNLAKVVTVD